MRSSLLIVMFVASAACGSGDKAKLDATGTSETTEVVEEQCTPIHLDDLEPVVLDGQDDVSTSYSLKLKTNLGAPLADYLVLQFINYNERIGDLAVGTFPLDQGADTSFGTCPECVGLWLDQATPSAPVGTILFQSAGTIRLDLDPRTRRLKGRLDGVRFREIQIDEETLASTFVDGGACAYLTDVLDFDYKWVPPEWRCVPATYNAGDGCDCDCGAIDPDCYPIDAPRGVASSDCDAGTLCYDGVCTATCSNAAPVVACATGQVCTPEWPDDVCQPRQSKVSSVHLGQPCSGTSAYLCEPANTNVQGICGDDDQRTCEPLCSSRADCDADQYCYTIAGGADGGGKGYCHDGVPPGWLCDASAYLDGTTCSCGCGAYDPDCAEASNPVDGCTTGQVCNARGECE